MPNSTQPDRRPCCPLHHVPLGRSSANQTGRAPPARPRLHTQQGQRLALEADRRPRREQQPPRPRSDRPRTSRQTETRCTCPCDGKAPGGHCPTHSKPHPDRPQISQPEPPRPHRRASEARHSIRHTARHFFKSKAQIRHILAVSHPL